MLPRALLLLGFAFVLARGYQDGYNYRSTTNASHTAVFCYINGTRLMAQSRRNNYQTTHFGPEHIKIELCTHLVYGAAVLDTDNYGIRAIDPDLEHRQSGSKITFEEITELKNRKRDLQVLISVSGNPRHFSEIAKFHRGDFVQHAKNFINKYKFDGLNIDWRYPTRNSGNAEDKQNYSLLIKELKNTFRNDAKLLTATISPMKQTVLRGLEGIENDVIDSVDYWFIMALEYYGHWSNVIGANAPIRSREMHSVQKTIDDYKDIFQTHSYKLILVIPFYGKKYQLQQPLANEYDSPISKEFLNSHAPAENVILTYREICQKTSNEQWRRGWDTETQTPYLVKDLGVIVYDDEKSVQAKTNLALSSKLGGVMAFSIDMDDFIGDCNSYTPPYSNENYNYKNRDRNVEKYPLLKSMYETVERGPNSAAFHSNSLALVILVLAAAFLSA